MSFVCVTTHYIDENFLLSKIIICFKPILPPHDAFTITVYILNIHGEHMISNKIFLIPSLNPILDG